MPAYPHTLERKPKEQWEPLFSPFGHAPERKDRTGAHLIERYILFQSAPPAGEAIIRENPSSKRHPIRRGVSLKLEILYVPALRRVNFPPIRRGAH